MAAWQYRPFPGGVWLAGKPSGGFCGIVLAAVGYEEGDGRVAIRNATLACKFSKTSFPTLSISTSTRRRGAADLYTGGLVGVEMCP